MELQMLHSSSINSGSQCSLSKRISQSHLNRVASILGVRLIKRGCNFHHAAKMADIEPEQLKAQLCAQSLLDQKSMLRLCDVLKIDIHYVMEKPVVPLFDEFSN